ncbi:Helicase, partial [mine drainage metagenome]
VESQRKGALQLVFCDTSTPNNDCWNAYDDLRDRLVERGLSPASIAFAHEANDDRQKARLFEACRSGEVSVLVASTAKAGVATNIQDRAIALHHLDCPWRPVDIEQREGRVRRQGNQNKEVSIFNYVTEQTFDAYIWQTVERKAAFIAQVLHGDGLDREIEDISTDALSYAEVKAIA